jgi:dTDP-3-amino-3,4,6-trideoxy-alpha-D-glucose transaminase
MNGSSSIPMRDAGTRVPFLNLKAQYASIREEVQEAINRVLDSAYYVGGECIERFEDEFAGYVGARYAVALGSGTDALELVLRASGIERGDEVIVPANTFFATAEAVSNVGATPVFADVDPTTLHLDAASAERALTSSTRAIIPVHLYGRAMDMTEIEQFADAHRLIVIEDACQAHGARLNGVRVGGSGRPVCFSFYPGKNLGAYGDAGAVTCDDAAMAQTLRLLRDHGSPVKYEHVAIGTNSRLDAIQAAVLSVKLRHLDEWNRRRADHAARYRSALDGFGLWLPAPADKDAHNYHLFVIASPMRDALRAFLAGRSIETGIHYPTPLHLTPAYRASGSLCAGSLPVSERMASQMVSLPMFAELTQEQLAGVVLGIQDFMAENAITPAEELDEPWDKVA